MDSDEIYKIIGYTVAVIFFIYLISKAFSLNVRVIESFAGDDEEEDKKDDKKNNIGARAIFLNNNKETIGAKDDDYYKKMINNMEKKNDEMKETITQNKDLYRDVLSVQYNYYLYALISSSPILLIFSDAAQDDIEGDDEESRKKRERRDEGRAGRQKFVLEYMDVLKKIKDQMGILDFLFNELENIN
jgi:hypothetical protein